MLAINSHSKLEPEFNVKPEDAVKIPGLFPGLRVPPFRTETAPVTVPEPANVAVDPTFTAALTVPLIEEVPDEAAKAELDVRVALLATV